MRLLLLVYKYQKCIGKVIVDITKSSPIKPIARTGNSWRIYQFKHIQLNSKIRNLLKTYKEKKMNTKEKLNLLKKCTEMFEDILCEIQEETDDNTFPIFYQSLRLFCTIKKKQLKNATKHPDTRFLPNNPLVINEVFQMHEDQIKEWEFLGQVLLPFKEKVKTTKNEK